MFHCVASVKQSTTRHGNVNISFYIVLGSIAICYLVSSGLWGTEPKNFHNPETTCLQCYVCYWGEPERAPHRRVGCGICLYIYIIYIYIYISRTSCRKSPTALILHAFLRHFNSKTIHKLLVLREKTPINSKDGDHSWTYLFNG